MSAVPFNTHAFVKRLQGAGFTQEQAEVIADIQLEASTATVEQAKHDFHLDDIATRRDLDSRVREAELKLEAKISETNARISESKAELTRWIIGAGLLQTSLIAGMLMKVAKLI